MNLIQAMMSCSLSEGLVDLSLNYSVMHVAFFGHDHFWKLLLFPRLGPSPSNRSSIGDFLIRLVGICLYQPTIRRACDRLNEIGASFNHHLRLLSPPIHPSEGYLFIYLFISTRW
jgi:hypothetical protein